MSVDNYSVKANYDRNDNKPSELLHSVHKSVSAFGKMDELTILKLRRLGDFQSFLDSVEESSIRVNLRIDSLRNNGERDTYLNIIFHKVRIESINLLTIGRLLQFDDILKSANTINTFISNNITSSSAFIPFFPIDLSVIIDSIQDSTAPLKKSESLDYIDSQGNLFFIPKSIVLPKDLQDSILIHRTERNIDRRKTLLVKKPDYLGNSMWDVMYNEKRINVKINNLDFLMKFQNNFDQ